VSELLWTISDAGINNLSSAAPSVTFKSTGSKTVKVTAKTGSGASSTAERTIYVTEAPAADASFTMSQSTVKSGERVTFIPNAPQLGYTYEWSMPGAEVEKASTTQAATTYAKGGTYTVTLSVSTPSGNTRSTSQTIKVEAAAPKVDFAVSPSLILKGESFTLTDKSTGGPTDWTWK
jgi:PKD repeat protein